MKAVMVLRDTRQAILEAGPIGLQPFYITIDEKAENYFPFLFGVNRYVVIRHVEELPKKLSLLYMR